FIYEIIRLFEVYPKLGMLGVIGSKTLPKGIWWQSLNLYGTVYHTLAGKGNIDLMSYSSVRNDYEKILAIDGLIMMTQYDLEWREDIFQGWHFYDISQCLEFIKAGYEVGVPKQRGPWCLHDTGITNDSGYEKDRKIFIEKYKDFIL
ncbi:glycosyltransferase family protein, partial [Bacillus pseudomycoides]